MRPRSSRHCRAVALAVAAFVGAGRAGAADVVAPAPTSPHGPVAPRLPGALGWSCEIYPQLTPSLEREGRDLRLRFSLANDGAVARTVTLHRHCPAGQVTLHGLPAGFDPLHTCQMGACIGESKPLEISVPPHGQVPIGETLLRAAGDACNPPMPPGRLSLSVSVEAETRQALICERAPQAIEHDGPTGRLRLVAPRRPAPAKPALEPPPPRPATVVRAPPPPPATRAHPCPACAFACPNGFPMTGVGPDGCPRCGCEGGLIGTAPAGR